MRAYIAVHSVGKAASGIVGLMLVSYFARGVEIVVPAARISNLFTSFVPLLMAVLVVGTLASSMGSWEGSGGTAAARVSALVTALLALWAAVCLVLCGLMEQSVEYAIDLLRSLAIWLGAAFLGGRMLGWRLTWIAPLATVLPLSYWSQGADGRPRWWDWLHQPANSVPLLAVALAALVAGGLCWYTTPWRLSGLLLVRKVRTELLGIRGHLN
jgi:hypothetical protein